MVVLKDGRKISFAEISKLPQEQQDNIIGEMSGKEKLFYKRWYVEVANQEEKKIDANIQAANQEEKKIDKQLII